MALRLIGFYAEGVEVSKPRVAKLPSAPWVVGRPPIYPDRGCIRNTNYQLGIRLDTTPSA
jgi:hypothetical protein